MVLSKVDTSFNIPVSSLVTVFMKARMKWYLRAVLLFLFLMPSDVKMLLVCRLTRYKSSLVKRLLRSFALFFFFGWFVLLLSSVMSYLYFLDISPLLEICIVNAVSL